MKRLVLLLMLAGGAAAAVFLVPDLRRAVGLTPDGALPRGANGCPTGMVAIDGGTFTMGKEGAKDDQGPAHSVTLTGYCIDETEVSTAAYRRCVAAGACGEGDTTWDKCHLNRDDREDHPVNCLSWDMARSYCAWIGGRLPTEAEWEYAARGPKGYRYPWGNAAPTRRRAHFSKGSAWLTVSKPVRSMETGKSPFGLYHMAGNICELVADYWSERYPDGAVTDPKGPSSGKMRICRGGSYNNKGAADISTTFRRRGYQGTGTDELTGVRCAADRG